MFKEANVFIWLSKDGQVVPGSVRHGHNVFTDYGKEWLKQLVVWGTIGAADVALTEGRFRWVGVGSGFLPELSSVEGLHTPLTITTGPDEYIRALGPKTTPVNTSVRYSTTFLGAGSDFDHHGATVDVSEAAIFVDVHDGVSTQLDPSVGTHMPVAYKSFVPVTKAADQNLIVTWEFRF